MPNYQGFLLFFSRSALHHYRATPDLCLVEEDDMGGRIEQISNAYNNASWYQVRFGFRRLANGQVCLAVFGPDFKKLPEREKLIWFGHHLENPEFQEKDDSFDRWVSRNLEGSLRTEDGPIPRIERHVRLVRALTRQTLGKPLFRFESHPLINYPIAENTDSYAKAHLELYRLLIDGLDSEVISQLAAHLGIDLSDTSKTVNSLKEILPDYLVQSLHKPLLKCSKTRNKTHGVPSKPASSYPAFDTFDEDLRRIAEGLVGLCSWIEDVLNANADNCLKRESVMETWFPKIIGPPKPEFKLDEARQAEGKTIRSIEFGEEPDHPDKHTSEAIVFNFTDGSSMAVVVGSNASNISSTSKKIRTNDIHTDLVIMWLPPISKE